MVHWGVINATTGSRAMLLQNFILLVFPQQQTRNINLQFHTGNLFSPLQIKFVALGSFFQDRRSFGFFFEGNAPFDVGTDGLIDEIICPYFDPFCQGTTISYSQQNLIGRKLDKK